MKIDRSTVSGSEVRGQRVAHGHVRPEWIDYNDHMNVAYYVLAFDLAIDALWARLGIDDAYIERTRGSTFAVETHVTYQRELRLDEAYFVTAEIVAYDKKRIHQFQRMYRSDDSVLAATGEWLSLHVDLDRRRVTDWPGSVLAELAAIAAEQKAAAPPDELCGRIEISNPVYRIDAGGR